MGDRIVTQEVTVKRLIELLRKFKDDTQPVYGVNGDNIGNTLITHVETHGVVLEFKL